MVNAPPVRVSFAAVAHATSPEDLHKVRKSSTESSAAVNSGYDKREPFESCSPSLRSQTQSKKSEVGKRSPNNANKTDNYGDDWSHVHELDEELDSLRRKLMQEADSAKKLSDEVKYRRACRESPPNALNVTFDKSDKGSTGQVDSGQHSWLLSSVLTKIQPGGLLIEACSTPSSPFQCLPKLENRAIRASRSGDFQDSPGDGNALKCSELNLFRVESGVYDELINGINESIRPTQWAEDCNSRAAPIGHRVQSPPWTFSEAKLDIANYKNCQFFEPSEDLLHEHLDVSSLIEDSELITNWEKSFGKLYTEERLSRDQSLLEDAPQSWQLLGQEEVDEDGLDAKSCSFIQKRQKNSEKRTDGSRFDRGSCYSMALSEVPAVEESGLAMGSRVGAALSSSRGMLNEAEVRHDITRDGQTIYAAEGTNMDMELECHTESLLSQAEFCTGTDESSNDTTSQSCFSPQFKLSKRLWSSKRKSAPERKDDILLVAHNLQQNNSDAHEARLLYTHPARQKWQQIISSEDDNHPFSDALSHLSTECSEKQNDSSGNFSDGAGVQLDHINRSSDTSTLKTSVQQGCSQVSSVVEETVAKRNDNLNLASCVPTEEENGAQRKKLRHLVNSSPERVLKQMRSKKPQHASVLVEAEQASVVDSTFGDDYVNSSAAGASIPYKKLDSKFWLSNEGPFKQKPASSTATSSSLQFQTPPKFIDSHPSPARLADDRPILGTVAAHWSPISTRKWWDGKGIPNSTNKYKEDQKVSWHAIPFEVRLEQALAKQDCILPK